MTIWVWIITGLAITVMVLVFIMYRAPLIDDVIEDVQMDDTNQPVKQNLNPTYNKNVKRGTDGRFKSKANG